jgi:hypothetical protein
MDICNNNPIKTELSREDFLYLYNQFSIPREDMKLQEVERENGYSDLLDGTMLDSIAFDRDEVIGKYIPRANDTIKYIYSVDSNRKLKQDNINAYCQNYVLYNQTGNNVLSYREYIYFVSMYNYIIYNLKHKYGEILCRRFDTREFKLYREDIINDNNLMDRIRIADLCYLLSLRLLIPAQSLAEMIKSTHKQDLFDRIKNYFYVSEYSVYTRLNQMLDRYLVDEIKHNNDLEDNIRESIESYKIKLNTK